MWLLYTPFVGFLEKATGEPWELHLPASHDALIEEVCTGKVDLAFLGPVPLARANKRCGAVPFLVPLGAGGTPDYSAVLLTTDPAVHSVESLRGKEVGFFKGSTAAHVVPAQMLAEAGLGPGTYRPVFLESQDKLMSALLARKLSAAGVKSALHRRFEREGGIRVLRTSAPLPNFSFVALPSLPAAARQRLTSGLLALQPRTKPSDAETVKGWDDEVKNGFISPPPGFLASVLALQDVTERVLGDAR
jgi:phosphonate transport system substrate-binding protein